MVVCLVGFGGGFLFVNHDNLVSDESNYLNQTTTLCTNTNKIIVQLPIEMHW